MENSKMSFSDKMIIRNVQMALHSLNESLTQAHKAGLICDIIKSDLSSFGFSEDAYTLRGVFMKLELER